MMRLKLDLEKLDASLKTLKERHEIVENPRSQSLEAQPISVLADEHALAIPDTSSFRC